MLRATFDNKLTYEKQVRFFLKKASRNIYTLAGVILYIDLQKDKFSQTPFSNFTLTIVH